MIAIIDYQMGNLRSVQKAFEKVGHAATITDDPQTILAAQRVILPGVGAFGDAMHELKSRGLDQIACEVFRAGTPLLGICLGMQLLFDHSHEHGTHQGLGIVSGTVEPFQLDPKFKVPHMGWNLVSVTDSASKHCVFQPLIEPKEHVYFVHSFFCQPKDHSITALTSEYGGEFCAAIAFRNVVAMQFHPEKSQSVGLGLLKRFAEWNPNEASR